MRGNVLVVDDDPNVIEIITESLKNRGYVTESSFNGEDALKKYDWFKPTQPLNDCLVGDLDGDGQQEIMLAKADGYILVYDEAGALVHTELVGEAIRALALVALPGGGRALAAALPGRIVAYSPDFSRAKGIIFTEVVGHRAKKVHVEGNRLILGKDGQRGRRPRCMSHSKFVKDIRIGGREVCYCIVAQ